MDLSLIFAGTAGSVPTARRGLPALLLRRRRRPRSCSTAARAPSSQLAALGRAARAGRDLRSRTTTLDHWLGLLGDAQDLRPARARAAADDLRPARPAARCWHAMRPVVGPRRATRSTLEELEPARGGRRSTATSIAPFPVDHRRVTALRLRVRRARPARGASTPRRPRGSACSRDPTSAACRRGETVDTACAPEQVVGRAAPRPADRRSPATPRPCQDGRACSRHQADVLVHEATFLDDELARARETRPLDRPPGRRDRRAPPSVGLLALTHLSTRYFPRERARRGPRGLPGHASCRATSTRSRSRSPSAGSRTSSRRTLPPRHEDDRVLPRGALRADEQLRRHRQRAEERGHRVVFVVEESFAGTLEAKGFEEATMRLAPPPEEPEVPGQFWKDFIRETAPEFRKPTIEQLASFLEPTWQALIDGSMYVNDRLASIFDDLAAGRDRRGQRRGVPGASPPAAGRGCGSSRATRAR